MKNQARGVILEPWEDFRIYKNQNLQDCWYRPLYYERNDLFLKKTQNFIKRIREKPFVVTRIGPGKTDKRLYKHAEVIAKFYKYIGVLPGENEKDN